MSHVAYDLAEMLGSCQEDEGSRGLDVLCSRLLDRLDARGIAFVAGSPVMYLASAGTPIDSALADRALAAGQSIAPHVRDGSVEASAPVRFGGEAIGSLVVRWHLGAAHDVPWAGAVLTVVAAYYSMQVQRSSNVIVSKEFQVLLTSIVIILGGFVVFGIPYLFDHDKIYS